MVVGQNERANGASPSLRDSGELTIMSPNESEAADSKAQVDESRSSASFLSYLVSSIDYTLFGVGTDMTVARVYIQR
jgi:hypothetical protein